MWLMILPCAGNWPQAPQPMRCTSTCEMKYGKATTVPQDIQAWFQGELEARGIDTVYSHTVTSLLLHPDKTEGQPIQELGNRAAAVECLKSATEQKAGLEELVDELCRRLNNYLHPVPPGAEGAEAAPPEEPLRPKTPKELAQMYYAAFPALERTHDVRTQRPSWNGRRIIELHERGEEQQFAEGENWESIQEQQLRSKLDNPSLVAIWGGQAPPAAIAVQPKQPPRKFSGSARSRKKRGRGGYSRAAGGQNNPQNTNPRQAAEPVPGVVSEPAASSSSDQGTETTIYDGFNSVWALSGEEKLMLKEEGEAAVVVVEEKQASGGEPPQPSNNTGPLNMGTALARIVATMLSKHKTDADIFEDPVRFWDWTRNGCGDTLLQALGNHALFGEAPNPASCVLDAGQGDGLAKQQLAAKLDTGAQWPDRERVDLSSGDVGDHAVGPAQEEHPAPKDDSSAGQPIAEASGGTLQGGACCARQGNAPVGAQSTVDKRPWSKSNLWHPTWVQDLLLVRPAAEVPAMFQACAPSGPRHEQAVPGTSGGQPWASALVHGCCKGHKNPQGELGPAGRPLKSSLPPRRVSRAEAAALRKGLDEKIDDLLQHCQEMTKPWDTGTSGSAKASTSKLRAAAQPFTPQSCMGLTNATGQGARPKLPLAPKPPHCDESNSRPRPTEHAQGPSAESRPPPAAHYQAGAGQPVQHPTGPSGAPAEHSPDHSHGPVSTRSSATAPASRTFFPRGPARPLFGLGAMLEDEAAEKLAYDVANSCIIDDPTPGVVLSIAENGCIATKVDSNSINTSSEQREEADRHCETVEGPSFTMVPGTSAVPSGAVSVSPPTASHTTQAPCTAAQMASWPSEATQSGSSEHGNYAGAHPKPNNLSSKAFLHAPRAASGMQGPLALPDHFPTNGPPSAPDHSAMLQHHLVSVPASPAYAHPFHVAFPNGSSLPPPPVGHYGAIPWAYPYSPAQPSHAAMPRPAAWHHDPAPWTAQGARPSYVPPHLRPPHRLIVTPPLRLNPGPRPQWNSPWAPPWPPLGQPPWPSRIENRPDLRAPPRPMNDCAPQAWPHLPMGTPVMPAPSMQACITAPAFVPQAATPRLPPPPGLYFQRPAMPNNTGLLAEPVPDPQAVPTCSAAEDSDDSRATATTSPVPTTSATTAPPPVPFSQPPTAVHETSNPVGPAPHPFVHHTPKTPLSRFPKGPIGPKPLGLSAFPRLPPRLAPRGFVPRPFAAMPDFTGAVSVSGPETHGMEGSSVPEDAEQAQEEQRAEQQLPITMGPMRGGGAQESASREGLQLCGNGGCSLSSCSSPTESHSPGWHIISTGQSRCSSDKPGEPKETLSIAPDSRQQAVAAPPPPAGRFKKKRR